MESLSNTDREEVDVDARPTPSQNVGPLRISLQKKGEKSEFRTSKVCVSGKVNPLFSKSSSFSCSDLWL